MCEKCGCHEVEKEKKYRCESCGRTSDKKKTCCDKPMRKNG